MSQTIASRELVILDGGGVAVHCTHHRVHSLDSGDSGYSVGEQRVGVVFLNSLFLPRTATGDSAVYWAEAFAKCGYPAFRIDLPGLGDTYAPLNTKLLEFINDGGWESIAAAKIDELVERFRLSGVVILGHCAGSVSAIFAGAATKNCKGLLLLDPYFFLPPRMKNSKAWKRLVRWAASNRFGGFLSKLYDRLKKLGLAVRGNAPPPNANFPLLQRWKEVASKRRLPILLFKAPARRAAGTKPRVGEFDYLQHVQALAGQRGKVTVQLIEGTDHSFANRSGRDAVRRSIENWLSFHFPLSAIDDAANDALQTVAVETRIDSEKHAPCL